VIPDTWQRRFKWTVYTLLLINFFIYVYQDIESAAYTLGADSSLLHWARAYVTTIDLIAWFLLIAFFELETGVLAGRLEAGGRRRTVQAVRILCYVAILHTTFADVSILRDFQTAVRLPASADLCAYADGSWSFLENRDYTTIEPDNCTTIGSGPEFFAIDPEPVVTDRAGLHEAVVLAWTDLAENIAWLLIVLANEIIVRMQTRGITGGTALALVNRPKVALYAVIVGIACYWASKGQFLYFWDEILWVGGFLAIEGNLHAHRLRVRASRRPAD